MARLSREILLRRAEHVVEAFHRHRCRQEDLFEALTPFYIWRTDNNQVLARGVQGYDAAKDKANELRKKLGLQWDQVKFKSERKSSSGGSSSGSYKASTFGRGVPKGRMDYSKNYNPSKRGRFRGYYDKDGNYHDLD